MPPPDDDQGSLRDAGREPSVARETAADLADDLRWVAQPIVDEAVSSVSFMLLAVLMVPVGIVIVAVGFVAMSLAYRALGSPTGTLASAITIAGLLGILAALFFCFRALYRRMPRRLRAAYAAPMQQTGPDGANASRNRVIVADAIDGSPDRDTPSTQARTLADLDARLAPGPNDPD